MSVTAPSPIDQIAERVERLLLRHEEIQRTNVLLQQEVDALTRERDALRTRLGTARTRLDALLERLPAEPSHDPAAPMKQIEVQIMDQSYLLGCPEGGEAQLREAVERVDSAMCKIRDAGKVRARDRIAVLASLNLAFDLGQQAPAAPAPPAPAASAPAAPQGATDNTADALRAAQLIQRLDQALAGDDHLL